MKICINTLILMGISKVAEYFWHRTAPLWVGETKVCSNGPDNMTKMAAMPMYGKIPLKLFLSGTNRARALTRYAELGAQF